MHKQILTLSAAAVLTLAACGGGGSSGSGGGGGYGGGPLPTSAPSSSPAPGAHIVSISLPGGIGVEMDPTWKGPIGGYSQTTFSQVLGFPVGTVVTLKNISASTPHTFNVIATSAGPPANFPASPGLSTTPSGGNTLAAGYASGAIAGGGTVNVTLANAGMYLIGCAFHYASNQMRDVIVVQANATPGPQATPPPSGTPPPGGGGCPYC
jgi:plastocyanin